MSSLIIIVKENTQTQTISWIIPFYLQVIHCCQYNGQSKFEEIKFYVFVHFIHLQTYQV